MKIVIVEDERLAAEKLIQLLNETETDIEILQVLESVEESINWFAKNPSPDLVFMDIQLDDGISFEIFDEVKVDAPIIFTTAFDEYAIRAFKVNSIDYLLKPIEKNALANGLEKYSALCLEKKNLESKISQIFQQISKPYKTRFFIKVGVKYQSILTSDICTFFVEERNTFLQTQEGKKYDLDYSLEQIQKKVNPELFYRINRNYLININCIEEIIAYSSSRLKIKSKTKEELIVSRDKVSDFKKWMDR